MGAPSSLELFLEARRILLVAGALFFSRVRATGKLAQTRAHGALALSDWISWLCAGGARSELSEQSPGFGRSAGLETISRLAAAILDVAAGAGAIECNMGGGGFS